MEYTLGLFIKYLFYEYILSTVSKSNSAYRLVTLKAILRIISILSLISGESIAQPISVVIWRDTVQTMVGKTFTNRLTLNNTGEQVQEVILSVQTPASVQLLSTIPERLRLEPGRIAVIPIKGLVNRQPGSPINLINIRVSDLIGNSLYELSFPLLVTGKAQVPVILYPSEETVVLYAGTETAYLPLRIMHNQTRPEKFSLEINSLPLGVDRAQFSLSIPLSPLQDTTVRLAANPLRHWSTSEPYQMMVTVRNEKKQVVGSVIYKVVLAVATKRYTHASIEARAGYGASAALTWFHTNQWAREASVWGTDSVGNAQLDFQLHYVNYGVSHLQQLQNTYVSLRTNRTLVRLGSSYDYHELSLFGRGLKVTIGQPEKR